MLRKEIKSELVDFWRSYRTFKLLIFKLYSSTRRTFITFINMFPFSKVGTKSSAVAWKIRFLKQFGQSDLSFAKFSRFVNFFILTFDMDCYYITFGLLLLKISMDLGIS